MPIWPHMPSYAHEFVIGVFCWPHALSILRIGIFHLTESGWVDLWKLLDFQKKGCGQDHPEDIVILDTAHTPESLCLRRVTPPKTMVDDGGCRNWKTDSGQVWIRTKVGNVGWDCSDCSSVFYPSYSIIIPWENSNLMSTYKWINPVYGYLTGEVPIKYHVVTIWRLPHHNYLVGGFNHLEKYEFVNGKDYPIYYGK